MPARVKSLRSETPIIPTVAGHGVEHGSSHGYLARRSDDACFGCIVTEQLDACIETRANQGALGA